MRAFAGVLVAAVALGGALAMHNSVRDESVSTSLGHKCPRLMSPLTCVRAQTFNPGQLQVVKIRSVTESKPGWVDPVALVLAIAGVGGGLVLVAQARKLL